MTPLLILGCGYIGSRLARAGLAAGRPVRVCARSTSRLASLVEAGAQFKYVDAAMPKQLNPALSGISGGTVVYSIPQVPSLPPGQGIAAALKAAYAGGAACFIHFSSAGLYGDQPDDETWIDEDTPIDADDRAMSSVRADEAEVEKWEYERLRTVTLRLSPVYGPGRGVRTRLRNNTYKILDEGQHVTSRIHVDDVVAIVFAAEAHAPAKSRYLVADDEPTTQGEYARWLCDRMGIPLPPSRQILEPGAPKVAHRNRRIRNTHLKTALGIELRYRSFREGEVAIEAEEGTAVVPSNE